MPPSPRRASRRYRSPSTRPMSGSGGRDASPLRQGAGRSGAAGSLMVRVGISLASRRIGYHRPRSASQRTPVAELFVVNGICGGTVFFLPDVPTVLGRSPECHVQVADPWISSMHALFERRGDQLWVVDLDSRNGTFVADERVHEAPVAPGARLRFGKTSAELRAQPEAAEPQALLSDQRTII